MRELAAMVSYRTAGALPVVVLIAGSIACRSQSPSPSPTEPVATPASIVIANLTAIVERLTTTPEPGLVYRLTYQVRETGGRTGATLVGQRFEFSNGSSADGSFATMPHVAAAGMVTMQSTYSIYPATTPATHVTFSITYNDDGGRGGTATAGADIPPIAM
jgi:hypothetical protein